MSLSKDDLKQDNATKLAAQVESVRKQYLGGYGFNPPSFPGMFTPKEIQYFSVTKINSLMFT
jgi:hypothetical protein